MDSGKQIPSHHPNSSNPRKSEECIYSFVLKMFWGSLTFAWPMLRPSFDVVISVPTTLTLTLLIILSQRTFKPGGHSIKSTRCCSKDAHLSARIQRTAPSD
eukprot:TRINITY_DN7386_c0_g1_i1.p1 TRINITY_DN7386_c0_g1~~TRINITY_DN7386_c0_g1_i1.p1  ORF type:complete len:101 (+),score=11.11 TRINITY_DN7386_c0_g1_i1:127-429(+)